VKGHFRNWPIASRINCVALGAKQTSAPVSQRAAAARLIRDACALSGSSREVPAKTDGRDMAPDDSAEFTGERLETRHAEFLPSSAQSIMLHQCNPLC
jgi:hypothetical protein